MQPCTVCRIASTFAVETASGTNREYGLAKAILEVRQLGINHHTGKADWLPSSNGLPAAGHYPSS